MTPEELMKILESAFPRKPRLLAKDVEVFRHDVDLTQDEVMDIDGRKVHVTTTVVTTSTRYTIVREA